MNTNKIKKIQSLSYQKYRKKHGLFIIEGKRLIHSAVESKITISSIIFTKSFSESNTLWFQSFHNQRLEKVTTRDFQNISNTNSPSGVAAICELPAKKLLDLNKNRWIYMDKISDPGNMGSLIRSAAWFGLKNIALSPGCVDPYNPKVLRSGMGGHFNISIHNNISLSQFCDTHSIIAGEKTGQDSTKFKFPKKCVLVLGNEAHGHTKQNQQYINTYITLKKLGSGESLNVSNAGAILFHLLTINQL